MNRHSDNMNHIAVEVLGLAPCLREDLEIHVQVFGGKTCYVIEDPLQGRFCRVGVSEYAFISLLDGKTSLAKALEQTSTLMGAEALSEQEAVALGKWLVDSQLATTPQSQKAERLADVAEMNSTKQWVALANPLFQKFTLFCPEPWLSRLGTVSQALFSTWFLILWLLTVAVACFSVWNSTPQSDSYSTNVFSTNNWVWLAVTWLVLKLFHELGHALACKRFGGTVREAGVLFVLFAPLPFVDVTSSWRFDSKWKRIATAGAGMYLEVFIAAVAAIVGVWSNSPVVEFHTQNIVTAATLVTLLFNANPLMRFDGYYILSDLIEHPNLATHGQQLLGYWFRRYMLGLSVERPDWPEGNLALIAGYAIAALVWRVFITIVLLIAAGSLFYGAGVLLVLVALGLLLLPPMGRLYRTLRSDHSVDRRRFALSCAGLAISAWAAWALIPWNTSISAPAIVDFDPLIELRTPVSGFVREAFVRPGNRVTQGELLAVLENRELTIQEQRLSLQIEQSHQRARKFRHAGEIAAYQAECDNRTSLESRHQEISNQLSHLQVRAPATGVVIHGDLHDRIGTFVDSGEELLVLGDPNSLRVFALVPQHEIQAIDAGDSENASIYLQGSMQGDFAATIVKVRPRASTELTFPALGAAAGGPLAVRPGKATQQGSPEWELLEPHVPLIIRVNSFDRQSLHAGQVGHVQLKHRGETLGQYMRRHIARWFHAQSSIHRY